MRSNSVRFLCASVAALAIAAACESSKSSNPLSPTVAGPIPGVEISAPKLLQPSQGVKFKANQQPIQLLIENSWTTGARPLLYAFQIAVDSGFQTVVFSRKNVSPGGNGQTSLTVSDKLETGRTYYWRAWAYDGANTGPMASAASFDIQQPSALNPPVLVSPANGAVLSNKRPQLVLKNSTRSGPIGNVSYQIQVSENSGFSQIVTDLRQPENPSGQTSWTAGGDYVAGTTFYWRAYATDGQTQSGWSGTLSFRTPADAPPPPTPPGPVTPPPGGGTCVAPIRPGVSDCTWVMQKAKADLIAEGVNLSGDCGGFRIVARAASMIPGAGFKKKTGTNCNGFSIKSIMFADGQDYLVLYSPGTTNGPTWQFYAYSDPSIYQAYFPQTTYAPK